MMKLMANTGAFPAELVAKVWLRWARGSGFIRSRGAEIIFDTHPGFAEMDREKLNVEISAIIGRKTLAAEKRCEPSSGQSEWGYNG